ncbi:MAG: zinc ABC transporter substrate-binding protein, partial [Clostridia bacterium]|nr:zinc ABC transporter substrate-binding protein [Clostridia bacterium]
MKTTRSKVRFLCLILVLAAVCAAFAGCSSGKTESGKPSVVVTVFPIYDWVRQIAGDRVDITLLLDRGVDLHSYQPTADDVVKISTADMFIFVGGESDAWVDDIIAGAKNGDLIPLDLIEELGDRAKEEEIKEGMQAEEEEDDEEEGPEYDEHIWLSLKN